MNRPILNQKIASRYFSISEFQETETNFDDFSNFCSCSSDSLACSNLKIHQKIMSKVFLNILENLKFLIPISTPL